MSKLASCTILKFKAALHYKTLFGPQFHHGCFGCEPMSPDAAYRLYLHGRTPECQCAKERERERERDIEKERKKNKENNKEERQRDREKERNREK